MDFSENAEPHAGALNVFDSETLYTYQPLKSKASIRLLKLGCRDSNEARKVDCEVFEVELSTQPKFEAISYTWGKPPFTANLETPSGSIRIPQNLANALQQLTPRENPSYLWADAVCIDQSNNSERSSQVAIMGDIFQKARRVLVWLGLSDERTAQIFKLFRTLSSRAEEYGIDPSSVDTAEQPWEAAPADPAHRRLLDNIAADYDFSGMDQFYSNIWFQRLWVVQETALAREIQIHCGDHDISWKEFLTAAMIQYRAVQRSTFRNWRLPYGFAEAKTIFTARSRYKAADHQASLMSHMAHLKQQQCSLDLDRIYSLLNLRGPADPQIYPDYNKSVQEVYTSTTEALMMLQIQVLTYAGIAPRLGKFQGSRGVDIDTDDMSQLDQLCTELPSWVADWRTSGLHPSFLFTSSGGYSAAKGTRAEIGRFHPQILERLHPGIASPGTILHIRGLLVDFIDSEKGLSGVDSSDLEQVRTRLLEIKDFYDSHKDRIFTAGEDALTLFARAIIADAQLLASRQSIRKPWSTQDLVNLWLQFEATPYVPSDQTIRRFELDHSSEPQQALFGGMLYTLTDLYAYRLALTQAVKNRTFFVTKKGCVGLAPAMVRRGDVVVIIAGLAVPVILRPMPQSCPTVLTYYLVGDCYVHGIMHGELLKAIDPELLKNIWQNFLLR
ncbi:MAG: hypothetical protein Q9225_002028 [Loekoesia sp. 1 TL-2023]